MSDKDITERRLESNNDVFADILNAWFTIVGSGHVGKVEPDDLQDTAARTMYKANDELHEQERDIVKLWRSGEAVICLVGIEDQTDADANMPLRVFGYEGGDYRWQLTQKGMKPYPVMTLVLYFGTEERWTAPRTLFERLKVPDALRPFMNDCRVNVLELAWLADDEAACFKSDFRIVVDYLRQIRRYRPENY